ncbi:MAG: 16S rRNA (guanine(527)-N(7))-methyltransferase RsmG [Nitrospirae bacterium]|nr:16S rRNA (guanine(527)-N(7))-methyltransferase RsmG [Nitrospirota bacterium]
MPTDPPLVILARGTATLGIPLSPAQLDQFSRYLTELDKWNRRINLTGTRDPHEMVVRHFLDSLAGERVLRDLGGEAEIADLGSGAGFPGLPLKIARPSLRPTLIEPRQKRAAFLLHVCGVLGLSGVQVVEETIAADCPSPEYAGRFDRVLMRAVADPIEAVRLARPLLRSGGKVIVWISEWQAAQLSGQYEIISYRIPESTMMSALLVACSENPPSPPFFKGGTSPLQR